MGSHKRDVPRVSIINAVDGRHLSAIVAKVIEKCEIDLSECDTLIKSFSGAVHKGRDTSSKAKSNTTSNLTALLRKALTQGPISFCNTITLLRVLRIDSIKFNITVERHKEEFNIEHKIQIKEKAPESNVW